MGPTFKQLNRQMLDRQNLNNQLARQMQNRKDFSNELYRDMISQQQKTHRQNQALRQSEQPAWQRANQRLPGDLGQQQPAPAAPINKTPHISKADEGTKGNPGKTLLKVTGAVLLGLGAAWLASREQPVKPEDLDAVDE